MFYQTGSEWSQLFWLLIGARKCRFSANQRAADLGVVSCVLTRKVHVVQLFAMFILAVRGGFRHEVNRFNVRTKCKGNVFFRGYHNGSLFESLRKYSPVCLLLKIFRRVKLELKNAIRCILKFFSAVKELKPRKYT